MSPYLILPSATCAVPVFPATGNGMSLKAGLPVPSVITISILDFAAFTVEGLQKFSSRTVG